MLMITTEECAPPEQVIVIRTEQICFLQVCAFWVL